MLPKHHKADFFLKEGLFDNLSSFDELEKRISELPTTGEKGDAFEVFAEAYLSTQKIEQAEEVFPFKCITSKIKKYLSLGTNQQDKGVDGVFKTVLGEYNAYQAKFRTDRKSITWGDLSTFMGLTDKVSKRVLFTNSNDITSVINERTGFYCIRGNDLDRLEKNDFETILKWLKSGVLEIKRKTPQPHQREAINDILTALENEDRATALMACGTGKTLVALWVSEQISCQNILVLLPSLTLVRQTLHEWLRETEWTHLSYLCVCSDPTIASKELDSIKINQSDLDFAVTTESDAVKQFLSQNTKGVKIVISTYQSAHIVAKGMDNDFQFDLGIFDEAYKTAGREGKKFGFALKDENLSIKKRLFLTATPRHYNINKKNEEGDFYLVYSMDNPEVYGDVAHQLSFANAARQNIICNYKVIISVVTSEQVNKEVLKRGEVLIKGDIVNAHQVANQIAFKEAINKYNIKRIFTFHKSVKTAKLFTEKGSEGIHTQLPEFNTFHVNGTMPTAVREGIMNEFKNSECSVISNARCLTEGVDLPAVDMVAFMSPKKSKVDIIQATGRAMRKDPHNPDKILGYILVPLYLETTTGESIEDAVDKADFGEVWDVLQALQEHDDVLADIIRQIQEDKGMGESDGSVIVDPIDVIGIDISLKTLQESITSVCVDKLGFAWDMRYGELIKYKKNHGNCNVPNRYKRLGTWVTLQRRMYKDKNLTSDRIKRLEDIGFVWGQKSTWEEMCDALKEYKEEHGDCNVPQSWEENGLKLGEWVSCQHTRYRDGILSTQHIIQLENIGFEWEWMGILFTWEELFDALIVYKEEHGDCNVPSDIEEYQQLSGWVSIQRKKYRKKELTDQHIKRLENIGFVWNPIEARWDEMFDALIEYKEEHGDCNVPRSLTENKCLYQWISTQRKMYKKGKLSNDRFKRLDDIGFGWRSLSKVRSGKKWEEMCDALKEHKEKHGDCNVPTDWKDRKLAKWVETQRTKYQNGKLSNRRIKRMEDIGFIWDTSELPWEVMYKALKEYKNVYGHCNASMSSTKSKLLAKWVTTQRYRRHTLSEECIKHLEEIGFVWMRPLGMRDEDLWKAMWKEKFELLKEYKEEHGDCNVPADCEENKKLAGWVQTQRRRYRDGKLIKERAKLLEDLGFEW